MAKQQKSNPELTAFLSGKVAEKVISKVFPKSTLIETEEVVEVGNRSFNLKKIKL